MIVEEWKKEGNRKLGPFTGRTGLLMFQIGEDFGGRFGEAGDLPGLDGIHELLVSTILGLVDIFADAAKHGKRLKMFIISPHEFEDDHSLIGQGASIGNPFSFSEGAGYLFIPILKILEVPFIV